MKTRAIFGIGIFVSSMWVSQALAAKDVRMTTPAIRCEIRANDNYRIFFCEAAPNNMHFVIFSDQNGIKIYRESNSWGYGTRSFTAVEQHNKSSPHYKIQRRERNWKRNMPAVLVLNRGEFVINDINLCDGSWFVTPKLPGDARAMLIVTPKFQIDKETGDTHTGVWTGQIEGAATEVELDKTCVNRLNADR